MQIWHRCIFVFPSWACSSSCVWFPTLTTGRCRFFTHTRVKYASVNVINKGCWDDKASALHILTFFSFRKMCLRFQICISEERGLLTSAEIPALPASPRSDSYIVTLSENLLHCFVKGGFMGSSQILPNWVKFYIFLACVGWEAVEISRISLLFGDFIWIQPP